MTIDVLCYDAFTDKAGMGNPAGICFDADHLSDAQMQDIAKQIGYSETAFVVKPTVEGADYRFRYFTPGYEVDLCGHATVATTVAMAKRLGFTQTKKLKVETRAGLINIIYDAAKNEVIMEQANAKFDPFTGSVTDLFATMELTEADYDPKYPIMYGYTGLWTVVIPVKNIDCCKRMVPHNDEFQNVLALHPFASIHCFCEETIHEECELHARHFSASGMGNTEDPVTGTASGVMGAYYIKFMHPELDSTEFLIEQGQDMGRDGFCRTFAVKDANGEIAVKIAGTAACLKAKTLEVNA